MLIRNIIEIALIIILFIVGIVLYFYLKRRIDDAESDLVIRKKKEIKEDMKRKTGAGENYLQSRVFEIVRDIMGIIIENRETTVTKITFLSGKEADVEIEIKTPEVLDEKSGFLEKNIEKAVDEEYIKKYGEMPNFSKVKNSSKNEQKKIMDRIDSIAKEVIKNNIRNKRVNYNFLHGKLKVIKSNDGWKVKG